MTRFIKTLALAVLAVGITTADIKKPATGTAAPTTPAVSTEQIGEIKEIKKEIGEVKGAVQAIKMPTTVDHTRDLQAISYKLQELEASVKRSFLASIFSVVLCVVILIILYFKLFLKGDDHGHGKEEGKKEEVHIVKTGIAILFLLFGGAAMTEAATIDTFNPKSFTPGTTTSFEICTKDPVNLVKVAGLGVNVDDSGATVVGDCIKGLSVKVDAAAPTGKRMIETQATAGGAFTATGSEIEITAAPAGPAPTPTPTPTSTPTPTATPTPAAKPVVTVDPRVVRLEGAFNALIIAMSASCGEDDQAAILKLFRSPKAGTTNLAVRQLEKCRHEAIFEDNRFSMAAQTLDQLSQASGNLVSKSEFDGLKTVVEGHETAIGTLRTDHEALKGTVGQLRTDVDSHSAQLADHESKIADVKAKAAELRQVLMNKGSRGIKKALTGPAQPPAEAKNKKKGPAFTAAR